MFSIERLRELSESVAPSEMHRACGWAATEIEQLRLAEEGAKEAFGHLVQQKRDLAEDCKKLRGLLDSAYETIRRGSKGPNV